MKLLGRLLAKRNAALPVERVAIRTGSVVTEVGAGAILHALFSTISANLEPGGWGTRFPLTLHGFHRGCVPPADAAATLDELRTIETEMRAVPVERVVWDFEDRTRRPSPYYKPGAGATSAADYFVTVNGLNLLRAGLVESLESAVEFGDEVRIVTFTEPAEFFPRRP